MWGDDDSDDYMRAALEFLLSHPRQMSVVRELLRIRPTNDPCLGPWLHFVPQSHVRMQRTNENVESCQCRLICWLDFSSLPKETISNSKFSLNLYATQIRVILTQKINITTSKIVCDCC